MAFLEQLGKQLSDAGQTVAKQTRDFSEVTQLNLANSEKGKQISQIFTSIGQSYYEKHKNDSSAEELDKIGMINALYNEISMNQERINQIKGIQNEDSGRKNENERICPQCHAAVAKDNLFCVHCGTKLDDINN